MATNKVRWEEMLPDELLEAIETCPVCWMAYGLSEPHGAYNALGLDWLKACALCERAAAQHGGVVAPPMCWHVAEQPNFDWPASMGVAQSLCSSLPNDLMLRIVLHQLRVFDARGFHVAMLVTGHYGGPEKDFRLLCDWYLRRTGSPMRIYCIADWECIELAGYHGDHAGLCETQQLMALRPELVDLSRSEPSPKSGPWCGHDFAATGRMPSRQEGDKIVASQVASLGRAAGQLQAQYQARPGWIAPTQVAVDELWHSFERLTRKYWRMGTTLKEYSDVGEPPFPGWEALGV
ncbi:MAG: creatininase family protein [Planctomycetaceae bacterium]|nr:creatininase family protein [Planctomycetaceae bacterium]